MPHDLIVHLRGERRSKAAAERPSQDHALRSAAPADGWGFGQSIMDFAFAAVIVASVALGAVFI